MCVCVCDVFFIVCYVCVCVCACECEIGGNKVEIFQRSVEKDEREINSHKPGKHFEFEKRIHFLGEKFKPIVEKKWSDEKVELFSDVFSIFLNFFAFEKFLSNLFITIEIMECIAC